MNYIYKNEGIVRMWVGLKPIIVLFSPETVEVSHQIFFFLPNLQKIHLFSKVLLLISISNEKMLSFNIIFCP